MRPPLEPIDRSRRFPASHNQEERILSGAATHVQNNIVALGLRLRGPVEPNAVRLALDRLLARHDALRLTFSVDGEGAQLHVGEAPAFDFTVHSIERTAVASRLAAGLALLAQDASDPFDVCTGPLVRASLVQISDTEHLLGLAIDHMLVDGRSCEIVLSDLFALLREVQTGQAAALPSLPVQFPDWTVWERRYLCGPARQRLARYWQTALMGTTALPASGLTDLLSPGGPAGVASKQILVGGELWKQLTAVARDLRASPFTLLSAVLKATIYRRRRLHQAEDVAADVTVFGALTNRANRVLDNVVGYFANSAVLRTNLSGDPTLKELMHREGRMLLAAMAHEELPHPLVALEVSPELYGIRYRPGVDVPRYLNFDMPHSRPLTQFSSEGLGAEVVGVPVVELPRSGLRLIARPLPDGVRIETRYRTDRFTANWVDSFLAAYRHLLDVWPAVPDRRLSQVAFE
jgi:hypothetical protein